MQNFLDNKEQEGKKRTEYTAVTEVFLKKTFSRFSSENFLLTWEAAMKLLTC